MTTPCVAVATFSMRLNFTMHCVLFARKPLTSASSSSARVTRDALSSTVCFLFTSICASHAATSSASAEADSDATPAVFSASFLSASTRTISALHAALCAS